MNLKFINYTFSCEIPLNPGVFKIKDSLKKSQSVEESNRHYDREVKLQGREDKN